MARFEHIPETLPNLDGKDLRVAIVCARFNPNIGEGLTSACVTELLERGVAPEHILIQTVPGALELPLILQKLGRSGKFDALVALGAVIRGETYHFEIVSNDMSAGIMRLQLDLGLPIANGVLTTEDDDQALARMHDKGRDCALAAIEMANLLRTSHA
ncbi:6,7-dimethyl-8-ribityllumazine synthase [Uliginosibacterium gangwonense]|uniref:6,7-dimethyl-8-ribityllumazine synthase n=1 Tax=Uliginosibacterium gangwonense TaxID=392736 RepID=UPI0003775D23|nr:6,7-dimethyl-8-ribityllumazine synthase [Uliginosibacterium gangwonense]